MIRSYRSVVLRLIAIMVMFVAALPDQFAIAATPLAANTTGASSAPLATTTTLHLSVVSGRAWAPSGLAQGAAIPNYHWIITNDDTGDPTHYGTTLPLGPGNSNYDCVPQSLGGDPNYPANCQWPSIRSTPGGTSAQVVAQGDQTTLNTTVGITLPNGKYAISVTADGFTVPGCTVSATVTCNVSGFKIDGNWFSEPLSQPGADPGLVVVTMQPYPLPLATIRMKVWNDLQTNGAYDTGEPYLAGFEGHIADIAGVVTNDWFGNPLCTKYQHDANNLMLFDANGRPIIQTVGGHCISDFNGDIVIPYLGPGRYSSTVVPPNGQQWFQTTTLEGWHDWDTWTIQGWNGYDPEFIQAGEPFPFAEFGFVQLQHGAVDASSPTTGTAAMTGSIKGNVVGTGGFSPGTGGLALGGAQGNFVIEKIKNPLVSLIDTTRNDLSVFIGRGDANGNFQINHVPDGDYVLAYWDLDQSYLLTQANISIINGQAIDMGVLDAGAWWGRIHGKVCFDTNRNGKCDPGEQGIPNLTLNLLGRDNSLQDSGSNAAVTDKDGNYVFPQTYPLGSWVVEQAYFENYYTVGITYQTNNQPNETTVMANGGFVDVSTFNQIGMDTRFDWAIHTYETDSTLGPTTGGLVGEMVYNTTRIESDAAFNSSQPNEPGIPGLLIHLYWPVPCNATTGAPTNAGEPFTAAAGQSCKLVTTNFGTNYYLTNADGSLVHGPEANSTYTSETWRQPVNCVARDINGNPVVEKVLPTTSVDANGNPVQGPNMHNCLEAPMMSNQVSNNSFVDSAGVAGDGQYVNGNYGFTTITTDINGAPITGGQTIPAGDWIVAPEIPKDVAGKPIWRASMEEDVNIFNGDQFVAPGETPLNPPVPPSPAIPPFPCIGPDHAVNVVATRAAAGFDPANPTTTTGVYNPDFLANAGSPYQGQQKPLCNEKLVTVRDGRSATPNFYWQTVSDVALPGRAKGLVVDDLNLSVNPKELFYGEKYGIPELPIGIYDFANRLVTTVLTDPNGVFEVELPSTSTFNCPNPASICPAAYRFVANDPGAPGHLNPTYNPVYRTIGVINNIWPGITLPVDLAPVPVAFAIENPGTQGTHLAACVLNDPTQPTAPKVPELFSVSQPYVRLSNLSQQFTLNGQYFGAAQGTNGKVTLDNIPVNIVSWSENQIVFKVPPLLAFFQGPHQLMVMADDQKSTLNGLTFHIVGGTYQPTIFEVGPGRTGTNQFNSINNPHAVQQAIDAAAGVARALVVVYPNTATPIYNPTGVYYENVIIHSPLKLQGVGPGGIYTDPASSAALLNQQEPGSVLDGTGFGVDAARDTAWQAVITGLGTLAGPPQPAALPEGEVILVVKPLFGRTFTSNYQAAIDGLGVQGGDVMDFVPNVNVTGNGTQVGGGNNTPTNPSQGGGIVAFAQTPFLQITNNEIQSNTGAYSGGIRIGTPLVGSNGLNGIHIANNLILHNGGSNLAGAVGIFSGANGYEVNNNEICGNFSAEYGGGISHFGLSPNSSIHDNRIYFNGSYDEGGGVLIAGEPPLSATGVSAGAGAVNLNNNLIQANLANDDGGGLRFLQAGNFAFNVFNNMIVNNISTHEGGGVAIDDAPNVRFYNNTVMKNITTATAATSNGLPAPAGLSTGRNNVYFQATLPVGSPLYSNPLLFNNIFWDNRAGTWNPSLGMVVGIGGTDLAGNPDPTPINYWDMGVPDGSGLLSPTNSVLQPTANPGVNASPTNVLSDPLVVDGTYNVGILTLPWRGNPNFKANVIVAFDVPVTIMGNYHLSGTASPAFNLGAASKSVPTYQRPPASIAAPQFDIDLQPRPSQGGFDSGADEISTAPVLGLNGLLRDPFPYTVFAPMLSR